MNRPHLQSLLRRTAVAIAATAASLIALPAGALTVTLSNGQSCAYNGMSVDPAGNVSVTCASGVGAPPPPPPGASVSVLAPTTIGAGSTANVTIAATSAPASSVSVGVHISGTGCNWNGFPAPANGSYTFSPSLASVTISIGAAATGATSCTVSIDTSNASALALGSPSSATMTVGTTTTTTPTPTPTPTPPGGATGTTYGVTTIINTSTYVPGLTGQAVPPVGGCPAPDPTTRMAGLPYPNGPYLGPPSGSLTAGSGVVTSFPLYGLAQFNRTAAQVAFGEVSGTSAAGTIDISIGPCPGVINTAVFDACNIHGIGITNGLTFGWANSLSTATNNGECYAPEDTQRYYNVRWYYPSTNCPSGNNCGWSVNVN